jgi:hypothetical protein
METHTTHCPTCRRQVRICTPTSPMHHGGHATIPDPPRDLCLDFREACLGRVGAARRPLQSRCPVFDVSALVMGIERARLGLTPEPRALVSAECRGCGARTEQERVGRGFTVCEVCRGTNDAGERTTVQEGRTR